MVDGECLLQSVGRQVSVCPKPTDVVDQHVEPGVGVEDRDGESPDLGLGAHVGAERIDGMVSRGGTNGGGDLFGPPEVATRDPDPGTDGRQPDRGGLPIPPVPPVTRTTLPAIGGAPAIVRASDGDDHRSSGVSSSDMSDCRRRPTQRVPSVDDWFDLPGFDELLQGDQVLSVLKLDGWAQLLVAELRPCGRFDDGTHGAEPTTARRSIV